MDCEEPGGDGWTGKIVDTCGDVSDCCIFEGDRCTGSGNNESCRFCFFRRGNVNKFATELLVFGVPAGEAGDRSPECRDDSNEGVPFTEDGHRPLVLHSLSLWSGLALLVNDFLLLKELLRPVFVRDRSLLSVAALYEIDLAVFCFAAKV